MNMRSQLIEASESSPQRFFNILESFFEQNQMLPDDLLSEAFVHLAKGNPPESVIPFLRKFSALIGQKKGLQASLNALMRGEVALGLRKPSIGLYDNALHFIGGAQKYGCTIAHALQKDFDVLLIANADVSLQSLENWYNLDLSHCQIKVLRIPFFEEQEKPKELFDAGLVNLRNDNPFHVVSKDSGRYDIFINNCMLEMVFPLANVSELICHFPEREISRFFHVDRYTHIIFNSLYTAEWIKKRWNLVPHKHIYPPVDMASPLCPESKQKIILSVSRFELSGNKQQQEMVKTFIKFNRQYPQQMKDWKLVLAGGSVKENPYLRRLEGLANLLPPNRIELLVNISADALRKVYQKSMIFWHFSGLNQIDPARIEHFGMTTAEAIQNGCVPIVFNGGGQPEVVEDEVNGFLFSSLEELTEKTLKVIQNPQLAEKISQSAWQKGKVFSKEVFISKVRDHFSQIRSNYAFQSLQS